LNDGVTVTASSEAAAAFVAASSGVGTGTGNSQNEDEDEDKDEEEKGKDGKKGGKKGSGDDKGSENGNKEEGKDGQGNKNGNGNENKDNNGNGEKPCEAELKDGKIEKGKEISEEEAAKRASEKNSKDVKAQNQEQAEKIATDAGGGKKPVGPEIHDKDGQGRPREGEYLPHYHPYGRKGGHIFFPK
jgi:hypothetical protein